jgi:hypothetical protein
MCHCSIADDMWYTNRIRQVFLRNLTTEIKLLFWPIPSTSELFFISLRVICNIG